MITFLALSNPTFLFYRCIILNCILVEWPRFSMIGYTYVLQPLFPTSEYVFLIVNHLRFQIKFPICDASGGSYVKFLLLTQTIMVSKGTKFTDSEIKMFNAIEK